jgi:hypothetical protein
MRAAPVTDPELIRGLDTGQAAYLYRGGVTFVQVKRLVSAPAALPAPDQAPPAARAAPIAVARPAPRTAARAARSARLPDVSALLDEAFGPEPAP